MPRFRWRQVSLPLIPWVNKDGHEEYSHTNGQNYSPAKQKRTQTHPYIFAVKPKHLVDMDVLLRGAVPTERLRSNMEMTSG
jgi:hypothetical protein